ncbi:hypothetical protein VNI00_010467 [Paramarasmius palmivorus]|uniref:Protein kinase domain-containing protein n=1 Tax=Paramarasmius palmivorus TaxID=297713 RepID=A0AAW0CJ94_9AGAR
MKSMKIHKKRQYCTADFTKTAGWYIIWKDDDDLFYYYMHPHLTLPDDITALESKAQPIPRSYYRKRTSSGQKYAPDPLPEDTYIKRFDPSIPDESLGTQPFRGTFGADLMAREAYFCEEISMYEQHSNVCEYRGVLIDDDGKLDGLCFQRHTKTLEQAVDDGDEIDVKKVLAGIREGLEHLHDLGIVHCDMKPTNVMLNASSEAIIIDFDSCHWMGREIKMKGGTPPWSDVDGIASSDTDFRGLEKIERWLKDVMKARQKKGTIPKVAKMEKTSPNEESAEKSPMKEEVASLTRKRKQGSEESVENRDSEEIEIGNKKQRTDSPSRQLDAV